ncbi:MAG: heterodisulfide reductase-related iron-sulfur binding cluster [Actinomycetota bacterium]
MSASSPEYTLFLGCMIPLRHPQIELSARRSLGALGIVLSDSDGFSCCPEPWNVKGASLDDWLALAARNLAVGERSGRDLLVLCNGCYSTLTEAAHLMSDGGEAAERVRGKLDTLGLSYSGESRARHVVQALCDLGTEAVSASAVRPLSGLKVAVHHGCHLLRPSEVLQVDDPFDPVLLEGLVEALGAEVVPYEGYTDCCGKATRDQDSSLRIASNKLAAMKSAGADCVVVVCPACFEQMDLGQVEIKRRLGEEHRLPVLHYCQLLALAQGEQPDSLGLVRHRVDVKPALQKIQG